MTLHWKGEHFLTHIAHLPAVTASSLTSYVQKLVSVVVKGRVIEMIIYHWAHSMKWAKGEGLLVFDSHLFLLPVGMHRPRRETVWRDKALLLTLPSLFQGFYYVICHFIAFQCLPYCYIPPLYCSLLVLTNKPYFFISSVIRYTNKSRTDAQESPENMLCFHFSKQDIG